MISHRNVIANTMQIAAFEKGHRGSSTEVTLGLLPQSHIYALVVICHAGPYRGDQIIVLPKFELKSYLASIQRFSISCLMLVSFGDGILNAISLIVPQVPPIIINMLRLQDECSKYDLSSVKSLFTGAAPLGMETAADFLKIYPNVLIRQGYGKTTFPPSEKNQTYSSYQASRKLALSSARPTPMIYCSALLDA